MKPVLQSIKNIIASALPDARVLLFGSRANGSFNSNSDYDIFIVTQTHYSPKENLVIRSKIHKQIADTLMVSVDLLMSSESDFAMQQQLPGHIVRYVSKESIEI